MKRTEAVIKLEKYLEENDQIFSGHLLLKFVQEELGLKPYKHVSSNCLCGHFDKCNHSVGTYTDKWDDEL